MHTIQTTTGFIVSSRPYGEAGKILSIFTREFGLVQAVAQGIRLERSKLRYHTQDYSFGIYSLVKGREYWKLTGSQEFKEMSFGQNNKPDREAKAENSGSNSEAEEFIARLALLLRRLLHGEEAHPELFDCVQECVKFIESEKEGGIRLDSEVMLTVESLTVARMLFLLGYIGDVAELNGHLQSIEITAELLRNLSGKRTVLNQHINKALKESML